MPSARRAFPRQAIPVVLGHASARPGGALTGAFRQAHADTCVGWIGISDSVSGSNARNFIGKQVVIGGRNCQIRGAAPRPGSAQCTRCMRWGHHSTVCRSKGIRCPLCGGPHSAASHENSCVVEKKDPATRHCLNCSAAKKSKTTHSATDTLCPFWNNRFDREWLRCQFPRVAK
jgi:hypothetical protein